MSAIELMHGDIVISALVMPRYLTTIALSAKFFDEVINREGMRLVIAIKYLHSKNLVHMDTRVLTFSLGRKISVYGVSVISALLAR